MVGWGWSGGAGRVGRGYVAWWPDSPRAACRSCTTSWRAALRSHSQTATASTAASACHLRAPRAEVAARGGWRGEEGEGARLGGRARTIGFCAGVSTNACGVVTGACRWLRARRPVARSASAASAPLCARTELGSDLLGGERRSLDGVSEEGAPRGRVVGDDAEQPVRAAQGRHQPLVLEPGRQVGPHELLRTGHVALRRRGRAVARAAEDAVQAQRIEGAVGVAAAVHVALAQRQVAQAAVAFVAAGRVADELAAAAGRRAHGRQLSGRPVVGAVGPGVVGRAAHHARSQRERCEGRQHRRPALEAR